MSSAFAACPEGLLEVFPALFGSRTVDAEKTADQNQIPTGDVNTGGYTIANAFAFAKKNHSHGTAPNPPTTSRGASHT
jgi:hypothetical protein